MAIKACSHERNNLLRNREAMQVVEESQDDGYCDITGRIGDSDLYFVGMCSLCRIDFFYPLTRKNLQVK